MASGPQGDQRYRRRRRRFRHQSSARPIPCRSLPCRDQTAEERVAVLSEPMPEPAPEPTETDGEIAPEWRRDAPSGNARLSEACLHGRTICRTRGESPAPPKPPQPRLHPRPPRAEIIGRGGDGFRGTAWRAVCGFRAARPKHHPLTLNLSKGCSCLPPGEKGSPSTGSGPTELSKTRDARVDAIGVAKGLEAVDGLAGHRRTGRGAGRRRGGGRLRPPPCKTAHNPYRPSSPQPAARHRSNR